MAQNRIKINQAFAGLNTDSIPSQIKEGQLVYALNAQIENFDGNMITYQNEQANIKCLNIPSGYLVIGQHTITEDSKTILFLVKEDNSESEIGSFVHGTCEYETIINARCLNFNKDYPIHDVEHKRNKCDTEIYWTDGLNPRRWLDLGRLPYATEEVECGVRSTDEIDCNKMNVQPNFTVPNIQVEELVGGQLLTGTYQFAVQYSNSNGDGYTSYYSITNPVSIYEHRYTQDFNYITNKAIKVSISNLDISGIYTHINLAVVKTINNIPSYELVGTYDITGNTKEIIYSGDNAQPIKLDEPTIFGRNPYYEVAGGLSKIDNILVWYNLRTEKRHILQKIANQVKLQWVTYRVSKEEIYKPGHNSANIRGYMRDEVYAYEIQFILKNGRETDGFHIPGPEARSYDLELISNNDVNINEEVCEDPITSAPRWKVYNTASKIDFEQEYLDNINDECYEGPYEYGNFSYWESDRMYPCNEEIWGDLAGKPIRHHKFPDHLVTNHHGGDHIYPIGVKIDRDFIINAINSSDLTEDEKASIAGFRILRGNRVTNKSVIAKGLFNNVGKYTKEERDYFYPNYPYNDVSADPYLSYEPTSSDSGRNYTRALKGFETEDSKKRYVFHSPDTHFYQPNLGNQVKVETIEYGKTQSHFVEVKDHSKYKFVTGAAHGLGIIVGVAAAISRVMVGVTVTPPDLAAAVETYYIVLQLIEKLIPYKNFAYQHNSIGFYNNSLPIPNDGNKIRFADLAVYLLPGMQSIGDTNVVNNYQRESSVYLRTRTTLPFTHQRGAVEDTSRYVPSITNNAIQGMSTNQIALAIIRGELTQDDLIGECDNPGKILERDISSYYGSIKRVLPGQYGEMYSYETINTGFQFDLDTDISKYVHVFGGDIFINRFAFKTKMPIYLDHRVGNAPGSDVDYQELHNVAYPTYWFSTDTKDSGESSGIIPGLSQVLGIAVNNFDCESNRFFYQNGKIYLFIYGIPYFYCESEVNVDYRQSSNTKEGTFYPQVGTDIPDDWLQEKEVSIQNDNIYFYNRTFSKQNKELFISHVPESYTEENCVDVFPNRAIYSERENTDTKNDWLIYKPVSKEDFPYSYGKLVSIESLENKAFLVRFENRSQIYNALLTAQTNSPLSVYLGNADLFAGGPSLDFADTDQGYNGTQHKMFIRTEYGHVTCDAKRGKVFLMQGTKLDEISAKGMEKFFTEFLPFRNTDKDNNFIGEGLTGVYDNTNKRVIITKLDGNRSFTISYSFKTESWISFHSYKPLYYINADNTFYTGIEDSIWEHGVSIKYNNFYDEIKPYILEYPISYQAADEISQSVVDYTTVFKYSDNYTYNQVDNIYFNKSILSNNQQCSGIRNLIPKPTNSLKGYMSYPKYNSDSIDILVSKSDNKYQYNTFWNVVKDNSQPIFIKLSDGIEKTINQSNMDYSSRTYNKHPLRAKDLKIRHILDNTDEYKLVSKFLIHETQISYK